MTSVGRRTIKTCTRKKCNRHKCSRKIYFKSNFLETFREWTNTYGLCFDIIILFNFFLSVAESPHLSLKTPHYILCNGGANLFGHFHPFFLQLQLVLKQLGRFSNFGLHYSPKSFHRTNLWWIWGVGGFWYKNNVIVSVPTSIARNGMMSGPAKIMSRLRGTVEGPQTLFFK